MERGTISKDFFEQFRDKIIIVGLTATGSVDLRSTPFSPVYPAMGIHACVINSVLKNEYIIIPPWYVHLGIILFFAFLMSFVLYRLPPLRSTIFTTVCFFGYAAINILAFVLFDVFLIIVVPLLVISTCYVSIIFRRYLGEHFERKLMDHELNIASNIQHSFLPAGIPERKDLDLGATTLSAKQVGGDLYDFCELNDGKIGLLIGDVSGKGVPAALYMAKIISDFRARTHKNSPSDVLHRLNNILVKEGTPGMFVTLLYLIIDPETKKIRFSNAGHYPIVHFKAAGRDFESLSTKKGKPIGILPDTQYDERECEVSGNDILVLITDGVEEAENVKSERFGIEHLQAIVKGNSALDAQSLTDKIVKEVNNFSEGMLQHDDITVLTVKFVNNKKDNSKKLSLKEERL